MSQLFKGFDDLCQVLFERKNLKLLSHLWKQEFTAEQLAIVSDEKYPIEEKKDGEYHVGFLTHIVDERQARQLDKSLVPVAPENIKEFLAKYKNHATPFRYFQKEITSTNGQKVILNLYGIMQSSAFFARSMHAEDFKAFNVVQATVDLATSHQMDFLGLGQFSSIVSENGQLLTSKKLPLTTGNGLTAAMAFEAVKQTCSQRNINLSQAKIAVVGFAGNICNVITQIASDHCQNILLVSRESVESNPKYKLAIELILQNSKIKKENLSYGHSLESLKDRDIIIVGTNSSEEIIKSEMVKSGAIILDISIPSNVESVVKKRSDVVYLQGGLAKLPLAQVVDHPWVPLKTGDCFACMAETILMGFLKENRSYSFGMLNKADVLKTLGFATKTGITLGGLKAF
jgi:predicted amino acid dehydrogenase